MNQDQSAPPIADSPLSLTSANFETRKILNVNEDTLRLQPTVGSLAFSLLFFLVSLTLIILWTASTFTSFSGPGSIPVLLIGLIFMAVGLASYYSSNEQLVINKDTGAAFLRSWQPSIPLDTKAMSKHIQAQDIIAIQQISRQLKRRSNKGKRHSTHTELQVNLCTSDGERHNAIQTLNADKADEVASKLAKIFGVPLIAH